LAQETAEVFLHEAKTEGRMTEAAVASRNLGLTCLLQGNIMKARTHLVEALRIYDPQRDREAQFQYGWDSGVGATAFLALASWLLGEVGLARELIDKAVARAVESDHVPTKGNAFYFTALLAAFCGNAETTSRMAETLVELGRKHGLVLYLGWGAMLLCWANAGLGDPETGAPELRKAIENYTNQGNRAYAPFFQGCLAKLEAEQRAAGGGLVTIDEALALTDETGEHWTDAFLRRIRGEILLKSNPSNTAPAEEAFLTAIAIAQKQKAKSFELRAALPLAKLYQSSGRAADAHAVLAPALEGFSPTPEFPEIEEAQTLLAALKS
jgi:predicted ATPase